MLQNIEPHWLYMASFLISIFIAIRIKKFELEIEARSRCHLISAGLVVLGAIFYLSGSWTWAVSGFGGAWAALGGALSGSWTWAVSGFGGAWAALGGALSGSVRLHAVIDKTIPIYAIVCASVILILLTLTAIKSKKAEGNQEILNADST